MKITSWVDMQISVASGMALIVPNDFLFTIFYLAGKWERPISALKLAKDLGTSETLVRDHLNLLVKLGFARSAGKKYELSELGKQGLSFLHGAVSKKPQHSAATASVTDLSGLYLGGVAVAASQRSPIVVVQRYSNHFSSASRHLEDPKGGQTSVTSTEETPNAA